MRQVGRGAEGGLERLPIALQDPLVIGLGLGQVRVDRLTNDVGCRGPAPACPLASANQEWIVTAGLKA